MIIADTLPHAHLHEGEEIPEEDLGAQIHMVVRNIFDITGWIKSGQKQKVTRYCKKSSTPNQVGQSSLQNHEKHNKKNYQ